MKTRKNEPYITNEQLNHRDRTLVYMLIPKLSLNEIVKGISMTDVVGYCIP
jgi:hypothetical protein